MEFKDKKRSFIRLGFNLKLAGILVIAVILCGNIWKIMLNMW